MNQKTHWLLFRLFFISGFCGMVYQIVWIRMAFASFGIITPVLSVVLSVFMLGLSAGAWAGGRYVANLVARSGRSAVLFYAAAELLIGLGAFIVPRLFAISEHILLPLGQANSVSYLFFSALALALSILPWCLCMGTTFPFMMAYVREGDSENTRSFSHLYLANVLGAMAGTLFTAMVLVEILGFQRTLWVAASGNFLIAFISYRLAREARNVGHSLRVPAASPAIEHTAETRPVKKSWIKWILFSTGFCAMAMEVVWSRAFTPILWTQVYSFASIVFTYLGATFLGSLLYRRHLQKGAVLSLIQLISLLIVAAFLPIMINDPLFLDFDRFNLPSSFALLTSICPLCFVLGYLTPGLIDQYAGGDPAAAGRAYALNVFGCILGPLFASYVLLPYMSERQALILLSLPFLAFFLLSKEPLPRWQRWTAGLMAVGLLTFTALFSLDFEGKTRRQDQHTEIRHDYAASVISTGTGPNRRLLVNGMGMTVLTPVTKFMVHLPLAFHQGEPKSALIICFGMGTTFRSSLSWDLDTTAVELVPSVTRAFGYYHDDATNVVRNSKAHIVIDDGRRYLKRTQEKFDLIVIDPPPPVEAAGSSLLYTQEFYELAKRHLKPHGIIQAWFPGGPRNTAQAVIRSIHDSFPHVRFFDSVEGWGTHLLASMDPIEPRTAEELAAALPPAAQADLLEWYGGKGTVFYFQTVLNHEVRSENALDPNPNVRVTDDRPFNEYFLLRKYLLYSP